MAIDRVIDLSESEVLEASLRALGVDPACVRGSREDAVLEEFRKAMREAGGLVTRSSVADRLGMIDSTVANICRRLHQQGRMHKVTNPRTSKIAYIPKAEP